MSTAWTPRITWRQLPAHVQEAVTQILGSPIVEAHGQQGGFSPGTADRVLTASGDRAFVKAISSTLNTVAPKLHRAEAKITALLPNSLPVPQFLGSYEGQGWVVLVLEDIPGAHPRTPWTHGELTRVLDSLAALSRQPVPAALSFLPPLHTELAAEFSGWKRVREAPPQNLDPWVAQRLQQLEGLAHHGLDNLVGQCLSHTDLRADNILLGVEHEAVIVDWPWASIGASWFDPLSLLINVRLHDAQFDVDSILHTHPAFAGVSAEIIDGFLAGMSGYFIDSARQPAPESLPTLRKFQQDQGEATIAWLRQRWEQ